MRNFIFLFFIMIPTLLVADYSDNTWTWEVEFQEALFSSSSAGSGLDIGSILFVPQVLSVGVKTVSPDAILATGEAGLYINYRNYSFVEFQQSIDFGFHFGLEGLFWMGFGTGFDFLHNNTNWAPLIVNARISLINYFLDFENDTSLCFKFFFDTNWIFNDFGFDSSDNRIAENLPYISFSIAVALTKRYHRVQGSFGWIGGFFFEPDPYVIKK